MPCTDCIKSAPCKDAGGQFYLAICIQAEAPRDVGLLVYANA